MDLVRKQLEQESARLSRKYGERTVTLGSEDFEIKTIPTGSLALDYALGTRGWPLGRIVHIYGEPDIGKSSTLGLSAFHNAQAQGLTTGLIAVEPGFDKEWAAKHGVDPKMLVVARPDNGEDAFNILHDWITGDLVDFIIFDSIGGLVNPSEEQEEGKAKVGGASQLVTWGIRRILMPNWKNDKGLIILNQVRDDMKSKYGGVKPPGGRLLTHAADIWVHLRQSSGSDSIKRIKEDGEDVIVGRNLTAHITRNKLCEGTGMKAKFWYYNKDSELGQVGLDSTSDIVSTGLRTGVVTRAGAYYRHHSFPGDKQQIQGMDRVDAFIQDNPKIVELIRNEVLAVMDKTVKRSKLRAPDLGAFDDAMEVA